MDNVTDSDVIQTQASIIAQQNRSKGELDTALADINKYLQEEYEKYGIPAEDELFDRLENRDTTGKSLEDALKARTLLDGTEARNRSRYGVTAGSPGEAKYNQTSRNLATNLAGGDAVNNARRDDRDFKLQTLQDLMNQGSSLRNNSMEGLGHAARNESQREANNRAARSQKKNQDAQMAGTVASMALMAAMMM